MVQIGDDEIHQKMAKMEAEALGTHIAGGQEYPSFIDVFFALFFMFFLTGVVLLHYCPLVGKFFLPSRGCHASAHSSSFPFSFFP